MSGPATQAIGNIKNQFVFSGTPTGTGVSSTSITIATGGAIVTFNVPGVLLGDLITDVNRPSNTVNGATGQIWVSPGNSYVYAAGQISTVLSNASTLAVTTPIETYIIAVTRPDTPNAPSTTPTGIY
jgi:hypothetical protein